MSAPTELCSACNGSGIGSSGTSSSCSTCGGTGELVVRDERGRFVSVPVDHAGLAALEEQAKSIRAFREAARRHGFLP